MTLRMCFLTPLGDEIMYLYHPGMKSRQEIDTFIILEADYIQNTKLVTNLSVHTNMGVLGDLLPSTPQYPIIIIVPLIMLNIIDLFTRNYRLTAKII